MNTQTFRKTFRGAAVALSVVLLALAPAMAAPPKSAAPLPSDSIYQLALPLTDHQGKTRDWRTLRGKPRVVSMFYTSCAYICPLIVDAGKAVDKQLTPAQREQLGIVLVSMDPARDTPIALKRIVDQRKLDDTRWLLASPPKNAVRGVAGVLGIKYRALEDGEFNHTSALILVDAEGRVLARTEQVGTDLDPEFVAAVRKATTPPKKK